MHKDRENTWIRPRMLWHGEGMVMRKMLIAVWIGAATFFLLYYMINFSVVFTGGHPLVLWIADLVGSIGPETTLDIILLLHLALSLIIVSAVTFLVMLACKKLCGKYPTDTTA